MATWECMGRRRHVCDYTAPEQWHGRCPKCGMPYDCKEQQRRRSSVNKAKTFAALEVKAIDYIPTGIDAFDKVIGGGLVAGSTIAISGPPKSGKSTLLVQIATGVAKKGRVIYASGEQSEKDIGFIVHRTGSLSDNVELLGNCGDVTQILQRAAESKPTLVIIDSLHTAFLDDVHADAGSPAQVKAIANEITEYGKKHGVCFVLICHVNKTGDLAGPKTLEHVVDTLVEFYPYYDEGDEDDETLLRELSSSMNRNAQGPGKFRALFEMTKTGIKPVPKKSKVLKLVDR